MPGEARSRGLAVLPPVEVMRPVRAASIPPEPAVPGSALWETKLDGWRAVAFRFPDGAVLLQSRSGSIITDRFPEVAAHLARLPAGTVLDGEVVIFRDGAFAFADLARSPAARRAEGLSASFIAFDVLAHQGRDIRSEPLSERRALLQTVLQDAEPAVQQIMATSSRAEALEWIDALAPLGVEGIVYKRLDSLYRPRSRAHQWLKYRWADTVDAEVIRVLPSGSRLALLLRFADGSTRISAPLTAGQARQVHNAVLGGRPVLAEVRLTPGRHGSARFLRLREP